MSLAQSGGSSAGGGGGGGGGGDPDPYTTPTVAAFSPASVSRSSFQVHQKSPLLVATPPQVTRALSRAFPWIASADYVLGLLTWSTSDAWESFLLVSFFWGVALYGDLLLKWAGNMLLVAAIAAGVFLRRHRDAPTSTTLDEILTKLNSLNHRIEEFLSPCTSALSILTTQQPSKEFEAATAGPALTALLLRILLLSPLWMALAVYPFHVITPRRLVVLAGSIVLTYHSHPAKVTRTILWRSRSVRALCEALTGLRLQPDAPATLPPRQTPPSPGKLKVQSSPLTANTSSASPGVKFTFTIFENQRRWLGVGWTVSLFVYERAPWTDEHLQPCPPPTEFALPETPEGSGVKWRWVEDEDWEIEVSSPSSPLHGKKKQVLPKDKPTGEGEGWWYYDNKWRDGKKVDGWGKYTRRRKWCRRAELVEDLPVAEGQEGEGEGEGEGEQEEPWRPPLAPARMSYEGLEEDRRDTDESGDEEERVSNGGAMELAKGVDLSNASDEKTPQPPPLPERRKQ
jgi:hypothetical protein